MRQLASELLVEAMDSFRPHVNGHISAINKYNTALEIVRMAELEESYVLDLEDITINQEFKRKIDEKTALGTIGYADEVMHVSNVDFLVTEVRQYKNIALIKVRFLKINKDFIKSDVTKSLVPYALYNQHKELLSINLKLESGV